MYPGESIRVWIADSPYIFIVPSSNFIYIQTLSVEEVTKITDEVEAEAAAEVCGQCFSYFLQLAYILLISFIFNNSLFERNSTWVKVPFQALPPRTVKMLFFFAKM